jgi:pimeloyl-ACP methyl ester carboxylesterase/DNA-binding CsgD family transcriptional regulator
VEQEIRFVDTPAARVAVATVGSGPPLVMASWWIGHLEAQWDAPPFRSFVEELGRLRMVVRYDPPGVGLSQPTAEPPGVERDLRVLEAVVASIGSRPVALFGASCGGAASIALAATRPELVERLVLYGAYLRGGVIAPLDVRESLDGLVRSAWGLGSRTLADVFMPEVDREELEAFVRYQRRAATPDQAAAMLQTVYALDASEYVARVAVPTLVLHRRGDRAIPPEHGRELAAAIPGARFVPLDGRNHFPWAGDTEAALRPLRAFLAGAVSPAPPPDRDGAALLSVREREVLTLVAAGLSDADIADRLVLSPHTVHRHVANVRRKLRQPSRAAAVAEAARLGLLHGLRPEQRAPSGGP